jgi:hypothetical protein
MSVINGGGLLLTSSLDPDVCDRIWRAANLERSGVDLDRTDESAQMFGWLADAMPDFFCKIVLGEVIATEWAQMASDLEEAARLCRAHTKHPDPSR